jgi:hypothetical protein
MCLFEYVLAADKIKINIFFFFAGLSNNKSGYESLVEATFMVKQKFNPIQQQEVVIQILERLFPKLLFAMVS